MNSESHFDFLDTTQPTEHQKELAGYAMLIGSISWFCCDAGNEGLYTGLPYSSALVVLSFVLPMFALLCSVTFPKQLFDQGVQHKWAWRSNLAVPSIILVVLALAGGYEWEERREIPEWNVPKQDQLLTAQGTLEAKRLTGRDGAGMGEVRLNNGEKIEFTCTPGFETCHCFDRWEYRRWVGDPVTIRSFNAASYYSTDTVVAELTSPNRSRPLIAWGDRKSDLEESHARFELQRQKPNYLHAWLLMAFIVAVAVCLITREPVQQTT